MTPERLEKIGEILEKALLLDAQQRWKYLDEACANDSEVRHEVESLLASHMQAGSSFLNTPVGGMGETTVHPSIRSGQRIGAYKILDQIGHGGMGEVFSAVRADGQYKKKVAIKLVRSGYDTESILERFRNERQILASLDHPNIARLLDGGTTEEGIPYLVMELVEGAPIDDYCDARKLNITSRLQLFRQVCGAVQYAHQRLVIHRDLKPSNILVTPEDSPKLLDFGIAKLLDASGSTEATVLRPMTPEYASPEQIRGETITTATDVYSLGVVLYQLLTGHSPYRVKTRTPAKLAEAITGSEPERPSTSVQHTENVSDGGTTRELTPEKVSSTREASPLRLQQRLRGDLDFILLKALRKEPARRYASVDQFAEDVRYHLEGLPVTARKGTWSYRAGKFVQRHKAGVAAVALVLLTLIIGVVVTLREARIATMQAEIARQQRLRAERRFNDVRKLANSLIFEIHDSIRDLPGSTPARHLIVNNALGYLDSLSQQAKGDVSLQRELAAAYARVGDALGYTYTPNLGDYPGALQSYRKALDILEPLANISPGDVQLQRDLADSYLRIASVLEATGDFDEALNSVERDLAIMQRVTAANNDPELLDRLAGAYYFRADLLGRTGDNPRALDNYQRGASILEGALRADPSRRSLRTHLAGDYAGIALSMSKNGQTAQAIEGQTKAVKILEELSQTSANNATAREFLAEAIDQLAQFRLNKGDGAAALETAKRGHQIFRELWQADPKNSLARWNFAFSDLHVGDALLLLGKPAPALQPFQEAAATFEDMSRPAPSDRHVRTGMALSYSGLGRAHAVLAVAKAVSADKRQTQWREACSWYEKSSSIWTDKARRGEVESTEREDQKEAAQGVKRCDAAFGSLKSTEKN